MNFILSVVMSLICVNICFSQETKVDSLQKQLLKYDDQDEAHLRLLNELTMALVNTSPDSALINVEAAIALAQKLSAQPELAVALNNKGYILITKGNFDDANTVLEKAFAINSILKNKIGLAESYCYTGELMRRQGKADSAKTAFEKAISLFEEAQNKKGIADACYYLGIDYRDLGDDKDGMIFNDRAIRIYTEEKNEAGLALTLNALGGYYYRIGNYKAAIEWMNKSMEMNERNRNLYGLSIDYANLSNIYSEYPDYPRALDYLLKSLRIFELMGNLYMQQFVYVNAGILYVYLNQLEKAKEFTLKGIALNEYLKSNNQRYHVALNTMGLISLRQVDFQRAFVFLRKAIALDLETKDMVNAGESFRYLGEVFTRVNNYDSAIFCFNRAIEFDKKIESAFGLSLDYLEIGKSIVSAPGNVLSHEGIKTSERNALASDYFEKSIRIGKLTHAKEVQRDAYRELSIISEKQGDIPTSFVYFKQYVAYKDSVLNTENSNAIAGLQLQYDSEKNEQQIALLSKDTRLQQSEIQKQKMQRNGLMAGCVLVLLLAGITYNRYRIKRNANVEIEKTMEFLRTTQDKLVEREKLAHLGKLTADVAREIDVPLQEIKNMNRRNKELLADLKYNPVDLIRSKEMKNNLKKVYKLGLDADRIVKDVLKETRRTTS